MLNFVVVAAAAYAPATAPRGASAHVAAPKMFGTGKEVGNREAQWIPNGVAPPHLDGYLVGDVGFDPLSLAALARTPRSSSERPWEVTDRKTQLLMASEGERRRRVMWMREAEIKHARLAMLAAAGWPMAELLNPWSLQATGGRVPSLFNGHIFDLPFGPFLILAALGTAYLECITLDNVEGLTPTDYVPGDLGFDPLGLHNGLGRTKREMQLAEIKNGRLAMMAITGMSVQEFIYGKPIVEQSWGFFHPHFF